MLLKDVRDLDHHVAQAEALCARWREAAHRLWIDGGPAVPAEASSGAHAAKGG
jgi:hypothetical protein